MGISIFRQWFANSIRRSKVVKEPRRANLTGGFGMKLHIDALEDRLTPSTSIPINATSWTAMGPAAINGGQTPGSQPVSGRVAGLAADPTNANILYAATAGGGVWKTTNGGTSWVPLTDGLPTLTMGAIAVAKSNGNVIYAGSGEANQSGDSYYGRGIYKSTDAGATWSVIGTAQFDRRAISKIVIHPTDPNTVYVAVGSYGGVNGLTGNTGVWKTTNGGTTWADTTLGVDSSAFYSWFDLVMDSSNSNVLYASLEHQGGALGGVYKTTNGGTSWVTSGDYPTGNSLNGRTALAISVSTPNTLYAAITNINTGALRQMMKTTNGGTNWTVIAGVPNYLATQGWYDTLLAVDPTDANVVFAGGSDNGGGAGIIESRNGGTSWTSITQGTNGRGPHTDHHTHTFDANNRLIDGNDGGVVRLENAVFGSILWTSLNPTINSIQFTGVALDPSTADIAYGGSQDNGTEKFNDATAWSLVRGGDGGFVRVDFTTPATVYHTFNGLTMERSDNFGGSWTTKTSGLSGSSRFYPPFVMDPANSSRLLYGAQRVFETTNKGDSWSPISTTNSGGWTTSAVIDCLSAAKTDVNTVYASANGQIFVTTNHGASWTDRSISGVSGWEDILVDPTNSQIAYIVRKAFGGNKVYRTTNGGVSWASITSNLPDLPVNCIAMDANGAGTADDVLFIGNDNGVYFSTNLGASWALKGTGLPNVRVSDLDVAEGLDILAAGTYGRGMWEIRMTATDTTPPTITGLFVDGTAWTAAFRTAAGNVTFGYPAQTGAGQLVDLPWNNINRITVTFSEPVVAPTLSPLQIGVRGINVATYTISSITTIDAQTYQFNFSAPIDTDWLIFDLDGSAATGVKDLAGNALAGTFTEAVSSFPTSGAAGQNFKYRFKVGVGDADRNGQVRNLDQNLVRSLLFVDAGAGGYNIYADIDGSGTTRNLDQNAVRSHLFIDPPTGGGPTRPIRGSDRSNRTAGFQSDGGRFVSDGGSVTDSSNSASRRRLPRPQAVVLDALFAEV